MRRIRARSVLGAPLLLGALALSCGGGDAENLFSHPSTVGGSSSGGAGQAGERNMAGAGHAGAGHPPSGGASGNGASGAPNGGAEEAGAPAAGSSGSAGAGNSAGSSGAGGAGGAAAGSGGAGGAAGSAGGGGTAGAGDGTCVDNSGCKETEYCAKVDCLAKAEGHCMPSPTDCSSEKLGVVCGCDGITYHDACLLHQNRQNSNALAAGACSRIAETTFSCSALDDAACADHGGVCAYQVENACAISAPNDKGICWVLPAFCPGSDDHTAEVCSEIHDTSCNSECAAIKTGQRYALSNACK